MTEPFMPLIDRIPKLCASISVVLFMVIVFVALNIPDSVVID